jgi:hypothetical protein
MHSSEFVREIIVNELVELYPGSSLDNSANPKEDFINFLSQRMNFSKEDIHEEINKLVDLQCIDFISKDNKIYPLWK